MEDRTERLEGLVADQRVAIARLLIAGIGGAVINALIERFFP